MRTESYLSQTALSAVIAIGCSLLASAQSPTMTRLDYTVVQSHVSVQGQRGESVSREIVYLTADGRKRTEYVDPQTNTVTRIVIENPAQHTVIQLNPEKKIAKQLSPASAGNSRNTITAPIRAQKQDLGQVTIDGLPCQQYREVVVGVSSLDVSWCHDAATGQTFIGSMVGTGGSASPGDPVGPGQGKWKQTLERVTRNLSLDNSLFEAPSDYAASSN